VRRYRIAIARPAADAIRDLHPDLKRSVRRTLDALTDDPELGDLLRGELEGLWRYRVRRFRIIYTVERASRVVRVVAVGPRASIYEVLAVARRGRHRKPRG
jgi:mRNA interferase RelE/StbE